MTGPDSRDVFDVDLDSDVTVRDVFGGGITIGDENLDGALLAEDGSVLLTESGVIWVYEQADNIL